MNEQKNKLKNELEIRDPYGKRPIYDKITKTITLRKKDWDFLEFMETTTRYELSELPLSKFKRRSLRRELKKIQLEVLECLNGKPYTSPYFR